MQVFKRKPEYVEAILFDGSVASRQKIIDWILFNGGDVEKCKEVITGLPAMTLKTMAGYGTVRKGNYIFRHGENEFSFMQKEFFEMQFEKVDEAVKDGDK